MQIFKIMILQLIYLALGLISLGMEFSKHGQEKKGKHNGWVSFLTVVILWTILYYGGFWSVFFE